ncbi:hypothetical protein [Paenibacillus psychroresistens]|uniref:hypothetical protein n=1 Tax=Paenibacillus psychroresistens TaxID=1778678 RepID=UPI0012DA5020|nr:hypothetical protein [Paenibacillus psychroresistens]
MTEENKNDDHDKEFYENVAKAANFVNERLHDSFAPGAFNTTVPESSEVDKEKKK